MPLMFIVLMVTSFTVISFFFRLLAVLWLFITFWVVKQLYHRKKNYITLAKLQKRIQTHKGKDRKKKRICRKAPKYLELSEKVRICLYYRCIKSKLDKMTNWERYGKVRGRVGKGTGKLWERYVLFDLEDDCKVYSMTLNVKSPTMNDKSPTVNVNSLSVI